MPTNWHQLAEHAGRFYTLGVLDCLDEYHPDAVPYFDLGIVSTFTAVDQQLLTDAYESGYFDTENNIRPDNEARH